jgi:hypothetical protein
VRHSSLQATRAAAASALPPARPAATGIRLVIRIASPGASRAPGPTASPAHRQHGRRGCHRRPARYRRPHRRRPRCRASRARHSPHRTARPRIHRHHVVVAVGPDRAHGELEVHLRRHTHGHSCHRAHDALIGAVGRACSLSALAGPQRVRVKTLHRVWARSRLRLFQVTGEGHPPPSDLTPARKAAMPAG